MKVSRILENIAKSKPGQKFYKWCCKPASEKFLNNNLPQMETVLSTACYVWSTAKQKNLDKDEKQLLQIQNISSGILGLAMGSAANKWIGKKTDAIIKDLDTTKIDPKSIRKISTGLRIIAPVASTALLMRFLLPSLLAAFSGKWMDKVREKRVKTTTQINNQLNIKA